jgi:uncharacterized phage protein (TIGR02220 family)
LSGVDMATKITPRAARIYARLLVFYALSQAETTALSHTIEAEQVRALLEIPEDRDPIRVALSAFEIASMRARASGAGGLTLDLSEHRSGSRSEGPRAVFEYWRHKTGKLKAKLSNARKSKIQARMREGYTADDLKLAIDGLAGSPWHNGENPQHRSYLDLEQITRAGTRVEKFMEMGRNTREQAGDPDVLKLMRR